MSQKVACALTHYGELTGECMYLKIEIYTCDTQGKGEIN